jgi:hypothetical protein
MPFFLVYGAEVIIPEKSPWAPRVSRHMMKPHRTNFGVMTSTSSMSEDDKQLSEMHGTIRRFDAVTNGSCVAGSSRWMTWCSGAYSPVKVQTNSPPARRVLSG